VPDLVRRQVFLDSAGLAQEEVPHCAPRAVKVLALPARVDVAGRSWSDLLCLVRELPATRSIHFHIADYLPQYARKLTSDLETALAEGKSVYLWASDSDLRLAGYPLADGPPWTDTDCWYRTAVDALDRQNGIPMEEIP
jgi:hypothetical protein